MSCLALAAMIGGTVIDISGTLQEGDAQNSLAKSQARELEKQAERVRRAGTENISDLNRMAREDIGSSRVAAAKSGVKVGTGSALGAENRILREYQRTADRYGRDLADQIKDLQTQAFYRRKIGAKMKKASRYEAMSKALGGGYKMSQYDWSKFLGNEPDYIDGKAVSKRAKKWELNP